MPRSLILSAAALLLAGCSVGAPPPDASRFEATSDGGCVQDRVHGLMWARSTPGHTLLDQESTYSWYSSNRDVHMSEPGTQGGGSCGIARCDTEALVAAVNEVGFCGFHDWRLPTMVEALSLGVARGQPHGHVAVDGLFPDMILGEYWTGTTVRLYPQAAWAWDSRNGLERADLKTVAKPVRLVRTTNLAESDTRSPHSQVSP